MTFSIQISGMFDYGKDCFRGTWKGIKIDKNCC